ncbi:MAG: hypothetical protein ACI4EU_05895 [Butyrivibrio sp.]
MLLSIGGEDLSGNVVDGKYSVVYEQVTDNSAEFTNIYGETKGETVIGNKITISATLENLIQDIVNTIHAVKTAIDSGGSASISAALPEESEIKYDRMDLSLQYNFTDADGVNHWNADIKLTADCVPVSGL